MSIRFFKLFIYGVTFANAWSFLSVEMWSSKADLSSISTPKSFTSTISYTNISHLCIGGGVCAN